MKKSPSVLNTEKKQQVVLKAYLIAKEEDLKASIKHEFAEEMMTLKLTMKDGFTPAVLAPSDFASTAFPSQLH